MADHQRACCHNEKDYNPSTYTSQCTLHLGPGNWGVSFRSMAKQMVSNIISGLIFSVFITFDNTLVSGARFTNHLQIYQLKFLLDSCETLPANIQETFTYERQYAVASL